MKIRINFYHLLTYLFLIAIFGWIFETSVVLIDTHKFTYRGFFFWYQPLSYYTNAFPSLANIRILWGLPMIDMYGYGGLIAILLFKPKKDHPLKIFILGMIYLTIFELIGSYICSELIGVRYWNYNKSFLNYDGRICLTSSLAWGVLALLTVKYFEPFIHNVSHHIEKRKHYHKIVIIISILFIICTLTKYFFLKDIIPN